MTTRLPVQPKDRHGFKIGIICALSLEAGMVEMVFDYRWKKKGDGSVYGRLPNDTNTYRTGVIAGHNVVLGYCPGMGSNSAAQVASWMTASFTGVKIILVVGICGAVPFYTHQERRREIVLGDCLISTGVIQFDFGRKGPGGFARKDGLDGLGRAGAQIRGFIAMLQTPLNKQDLTQDLLKHLQALADADPKRTKYPGADQDRLYNSTYIHTHQISCETCEDCNVKIGICERSCKDLGCDDKQLERHKKLDHDVTPSIHFGCFGSSGTVLKSGLERDKLAKTDKIIAFEMESAGVWDVCSTIVIKAACDYADSHKNKQWQEYAAAVAAAGLKAFLKELEFSDEVDSSKDHKSHYMVPFLQNQRFTGRESKLQELEERLLIHKECHELAVYGLGGVGKTQLALAFCYATKEKYPEEYSIFWVSALSTARFKQDYVKIAKKCSIDAESRDDDLVEVVQEYLSSEESGKWILVLDNSDYEDVLFNSVDGIVNSLPQSETGIILFTTRYKAIAVDVADGNILSLEEMQLAEANLFFKKSLRNDGLTEDDKLVEELLEELTFLPLAIAQASAYIIKASITIPEYLVLVRNTESDLVKQLSRDFRDKTRDKDSRNAVAATWLVSFQQIKKEDSVAADLLFFVAFLENKAIPRSILPSTVSVGDLTHAIGILLGYSFLTQQGDANVYDMHRLVHHVVKIWIQKEDVVEYWRKETISHLADIFPSEEWQNRNVWQAYAPHVIRVLQDTQQMPTERRTDLCLSLGLCLRADGRISEAAKWISQCVSWRSDVLPEDDARTMEAQDELASVLIRNGQVNEAVETMEKVVAIRAKVQAEDDPDRLTSQRALAVAYTSNGRVREAIEILEKVVAIEARVLAENHPYRLESQHALAIAYISNGQVKEAIEILEKVVAIKATMHAEDHPDRLASQHVLAMAYSSNGQVKEAIEVLEKVVAIKATMHAEDHPDRLASEQVLAMTYESRGRVKEAIEILEKVVAIRATMHAEDHPDRLNSQHGLAVAYSSNGQVKEAIEILEKVVAIKARVQAENHQERLASQHALAIVYRSNGQIKEAIEVLEKVVAIKARVQAEDHPKRLASQHELALCYVSIARLDEGISLMQHVVGVRKVSLSPGHPDLKDSEDQLSRMLSGRRDGNVEEPELS